VVIVIIQLTATFIDTKTRIGFDIEVLVPRQYICL